MSTKCDVVYTHFIHERHLPTYAMRTYRGTLQQGTALSSCHPTESALSQVLQVLHGQAADVQESLRAVGHAALLGLVKLALLDIARDALLPAHIGQRVNICAAWSRPVSINRLSVPNTSPLLPLYREGEAGETYWTARGLSASRWQETGGAPSCPSRSAFRDRSR